MGRRLAKTLSEANSNYTETQAENDIIQLYQQGEPGHFSAKAEPAQTETQDAEPVDGGVADTLIKYKKLLDAEAITLEEFELLKQKLFQGVYKNSKLK